MRDFPVIAIDFDDTCCLDAYPKRGKDIEGAVDVLKDLHAQGYRFILWTCREHVDVNGVDPLQEALDWFAKYEIPLYAINDDPDAEARGYIPSRKIYADIVIDDKSLGIPLIDEHVDWSKIPSLIEKVPRKVFY